jgi:hypothetical protein
MDLRSSQGFGREFIYIPPQSVDFLLPRVRIFGSLKKNASVIAPMTMQKKCCLERPDLASRIVPGE